jgi:RimJ/RimL family protein N-acetyltransferase
MGLQTRLTPPVTPILTRQAADWRMALPVLRGQHVTLRELRLTDAPALLEMLTTEAVSRFISTPPSTVEGFERFIRWAQAERAAGRYACFAIVPDGLEDAVGLLQIHALEPDFTTAEWGFALGTPFWGTGVFTDAARALLAFAFDTLGANRLEARVVVSNGRGNGALAKIGATCESVLHNSFERDGQYLDQGLWSIGRHDWQQTAYWGTAVH